MAKVKGNINTQGGYAPVQIERDKNASGEEWSWHSKSDVKTCLEYSKDLIAQARHELQRLESNDSLSPAQREALEERIRQGIEDMEFIRENAHELDGIEQRTLGQLTETDALRKAKTRKRYNTLGRAIVAAQDALHPNALDAVDPGEIPAPDAVRMGSPEAASGSKAGAATPGAVDSIDDFDPVEFADVMARDPEAAFEMLDGMSYKEKNQAFQQAQMFMQQIQRMMQLQSNLMKMMHDTQSTIIQNIR